MKMLVVNLVVLSFFVLHKIYCDEVITTLNGPLQGITIESEGILLEAYLGIPYAEPPVGRLRFAKPVPKIPWSGVYDASRLPPPCIQNVTKHLYYEPNIDNMTEDCLYLNIWVPYSRRKSFPRAILIFIHGGAFNQGSSNQKLYDGAKLAVRGDVVVVSMNYRVGAMGFFSAFIQDADGNMGLFDQALALSWVRDNAASFNGNPEHIVLIGNSAGAMSVAGHLVSPLTKHMIKRVILESGAGMLPMILDENARLYKTSQSLATMVGCANRNVTIENNPRTVVNCLKKLPASEIARAEGIIISSFPITFIPRMGDTFLPQNIIALIRNGDFSDVEMLIGVSKDEGTFFLTNAVPQYFGIYGIDATESVTKRLSVQIMRMTYRLLDVTGDSEIADFYINGIEKGSSTKYTTTISESIGDYLITCNALFHSEFHSVRRNPVYFYMFSHRSSSSPLAEWMGVTHYDEIQYVFGNPLHGNFTLEEEIMSHRIMDRWLAFAWTGNPNIDGEVNWPLYSYDNPAYLEINVEERVRSRPDNFRCEFWRDRYKAGIDEDVIKKIRNSTTRFMANFIYIFVALLISITIHFHNS